MKMSIKQQQHHLMIQHAKKRAFTLDGLHQRTFPMLENKNAWMLWADGHFCYAKRMSTRST